MIVKMVFFLFNSLNQMHIVTQFCPYDKVDMITPHTRKRFMNSHYINSCKYLDQPLIMIYNKYYTCILYRETIYSQNKINYFHN